MLTAKTKSSLSDTHNGKITQTTPRRTKLVRGGSTNSASSSPILLQNSYDSIDRSPKPIDLQKLSKPKLAALQEDLRSTREQLASVKKEKLKAVEELNDVKRTAHKHYNALNESIASRKIAEESSKIAKFGADEMEQASIEDLLRKDVEFQKKIDRAQSKHDIDVLVLVSATKELESVRKDLALANKSKDRAFRHSNDVMKIAEINAEKVGTFSSEAHRLNASLNSNMESLSDENQEIVKKLNTEIDRLKSELEKTKLTDEKLVEMEILFEVLNSEVIEAKRGKLDACKFADELKKKMELLLVQIQEAKLSQKISNDLLDLISKQLEDSKLALRDSESQLAVLRQKVISLNFKVVQHEEDLKQSEKCFMEARKEAMEMAETVTVLKSKLHILEQEKLQAIENEKIVASEIEILTDKKKMLVRELQTARKESKISKKAMEELASQFQKVSLEAGETRKLLLEKHAEIEDVYAQAEHLRSALRNTEESYQVMLDEARYEIICLKKYIERNRTESERDVKEFNVKSSMDGMKEESEFAHEKHQMVDSLIKSEEAKAHPFLKKRLFDLENEWQNNAVHVREDAAIDKIKKLSYLLAKDNTIKPKYSALSDSENECEFLDCNAVHSERTKTSYFGLVNNEHMRRIRNVEDEALNVRSCLESRDGELDSRMASRSFRKVNMLSSEDANGDLLSPIRFEEIKAKKDLLSKVGIFLKKMSYHCKEI